jgi:hypothetical protein
LGPTFGSLEEFGGMSLNIEQNSSICELNPWLKIVVNNRIRGENAHSKTQRSHKYVNNACRESSNSPPTLLFIPFPVPLH